MKYKILKGTALFNDLSAVKNEMDRAKALAQEVVDSVGASGFAKAHYRIAGGIAAFYFKDKENVPKLWKQVGQTWQNFFFPKVAKENRELLKRISDLPTLDDDRITKLINFKFQVVPGQDSLVAVHCPAVEWNDEYILVSVPDKCDYKPVPDMIEILGSEYKLLSREEQEEEEEVS
jgi:hypothetical protein